MAKPILIASHQAEREALQSAEHSSSGATTAAPFQPDCALALLTEEPASAPVAPVPHALSAAEAADTMSPLTPEASSMTNDLKEFHQDESTPADVLFAAVRAAIRQVLRAPMEDAEVATALNVSHAQAAAWLQRLVEEDVIEKLSRPARFRVKAQQPLITTNHHSLRQLTVYRRR